MVCYRILSLISMQKKRKRAKKNILKKCFASYIANAFHDDKIIFSELPCTYIGICARLTIDLVPTRVSVLLGPGMGDGRKKR